MARLQESVPIYKLEIHEICGRDSQIAGKFYVLEEECSSYVEVASLPLPINTYLYTSSICSKYIEVLGFNTASVEVKTVDVNLEGRIL